MPAPAERVATERLASSLRALVTPLLRAANERLLLAVANSRRATVWRMLPYASRGRDA